MGKTIPAVPPSTVHLRIRLIDNLGNPFSELTGTIDWGSGVAIPVKTTKDGVLEVDVPSTPTFGFLTLDLFADQFQIELNLTGFGPATQTPGLKARLNNLAYLFLNGVGDLTTIDDETLRGLERFRSSNSITDKNGVPVGPTAAPFDSATQSRLENAHDTDSGPLTT